MTDRSTRSARSRSIALLLLVAAIAWLGGCATQGAGSASPVLERVLESGKLRVGMAGDTPPLNATDRNGRLMGLEVDLALDLARAMGVQAVPVRLPLGDLVGALGDGRVDIVLSNMTMTTRRNTRVAFVGPYFASGKAVLTKSSRLAAADDPEDLDSSSLRLTALRGSTSEELLRELADDAVLKPCETPQEGVRMVIDGRVDAMLADYPIVVVALLRNPDAGLVGIDAPLTFEPIGAALPPGDALFENLVRNRFTLLEGTGALDRMTEKWLLDGRWLRELAPEL